MRSSENPVETHPDLYGALIREISIIHQQFSTRANQDLKNLNLNFSQLSLLSHMMFLKTPASITELADQMDLNQPAVTKMVQHLAEQGWIEMQPSPEDARKKYVVLKEEGRGVFMQAQQALFPLLQLSFDGMALQEAHLTLHQLQQIRKNLARKL
ncbi:MarR family winged helix-turn-helix transcriptional regulator [Deinococcus cellulosilyticus]|uniref:HTH marR-type domain-containing protein n=1 Tax=Deinococcus cellulosilyticus (strain DSM 18568 / NBRC 106333 / KACC 11606 / 5516J-15) TaxID=1223518 RepID=A0A511N394_DEIC1|nr:MarR family transcriptional regulator [Deinococcus cellulosilyticus]GEM47312.1 hypothetical protein DC3_29470 [Deinococcus cellulosilyticus NBRC 106333 = KACC 11606]